MVGKSWKFEIIICSSSTVQFKIPHYKYIDYKYRESAGNYCLIGPILNCTDRGLSVQSEKKYRQPFLNIESSLSFFMFFFFLSPLKLLENA